MQERPSSRLSEWLDNLARESWQLELIISGFAIFLLLGIYEPLEGMGDALARLHPNQRMQLVLGIPLGILKAAWFILLVNLSIHVFFRGLWISTIGLRSVSDDIDFEVLRLQPRFHRFLQKRIGSFDHYVDRLEKICSVLFAFTFLILFMLLAVSGVAAFTLLANLLISEWLGMGNSLLFTIINVLILLGSLLYFIDFVTLAYFKRIRWLAPVYYPIYRFFSLVTFARLYRPIYYNLIDNRFGRGVGFLLVPYILFLIVGSSLKYITEAYFPTDPPPYSTLNTKYYDSLRAEDALSEAPSIPSRFVDNGFLELFIPYQPEADDKTIQAICPALEVAKTTGLTLEGAITIQRTRSGFSMDSILLCMGAIHHIFVNDSLLNNPKFRFYTHPQRQADGLFTMLDVQYLARGEHLLRVETQRLRQDSLVWEEGAYIPFWKE